jgi:hypothetical protein
VFTLFFVSIVYHLIFWICILKLGFSEDKQVVGAHEYDKAKEKAGFVAGKHIHKKSKWWFQGSKKKDWVENSADTESSKNTDNSSHD